jgi:hypothetical protein
VYIYRTVCVLTNRFYFSVLFELFVRARILKLLLNFQYDERKKKKKREKTHSEREETVSTGFAKVDLITLSNLSVIASEHVEARIEHAVCF